MLDIFENAITDDELDYLNTVFDKLKTTRLIEDEVYYIEKGDLIKFDRRQPHASCHWQPFVDFKHYIIIHAK